MSDQRSEKRTLLWAATGALVLNVLLFMLLPLLVRAPHPTLESEFKKPIRISTANPSPPSSEHIETQNIRQIETQQKFSLSPNPELLLAPSQTVDLHLRMPELSSLPGVQTPVLSTVDLGAEPGATMAFPPQVYAAAALDRPVQPLTQTPFMYPLRAKRKGVEGWVNVALRVGLDGNVEAVEVLEAEPRGVFEESVGRTIRSWRFSPATVMGERVKTRVITTIRFELEE